MSHRTAAWLAWSLCAVCVALIGLALVLDFLTGGGDPRRSARPKTWPCLRPTNGGALACVTHRRGTHSLAPPY